MNNRSRIIRWFVLIVLNALAASAGEIRLRPDFISTGTVVRLNDIATLETLDGEQQAALSMVALFPSPGEGLSRNVSHQDVRETLLLQGHSLTGVQIAGVCRVVGGRPAAPSALVKHEATVHQASAQAPALPSPKTLPMEPIRNPGPSLEEKRLAVDQVVQLLHRFVKEKDRLSSQWTVSPLFTADDAMSVLKMKQPQFSGGTAPYQGRQVFQVRDELQPAGEKAIFLKVDVSRSITAVVARRQLKPGEVVTADDVQLAEVKASNLPMLSFKNELDVVGLEVTRMIGEGQPLQNTQLRKPIAVRKGEAITVYSVAAGISVKVTARSLSEGSLGDVIRVQADDGKQSYQARVTGPLEAMVLVDSPRVTATETTTATPVAFHVNPAPPRARAR